MKLIAIADLHCRIDTPQLLSDLIGNEIRKASALLIGGDLTNRGLPEEASCLAGQLKELGVPVIAVLGNHDFESGKVEEVKHILDEAKITLLQGNAVTLGSIGVVGIKGFCGGYGVDQLSPFGEPEMKSFVRVCMDEAESLEAGLSAVNCPYKIALMHYTPIKDTLIGESPEGFIFQGAARLGEAAERGGADLIIHGHSHFGSPSGFTANGVPVRNVCRFVLEKYTGRSFEIFEI